MNKMNTKELFRKAVSLDKDQAFNPDISVMAILPGGGDQHWRLSKAPWLELANEVWVAGTRDDPHYDCEQLLDLLERKGKRPPVRHQLDGWAANSPEQAVWVAKLLEMSVPSTRLIISTANYHGPRWILTFIKTWLKRGHTSRPVIRFVGTDGPINESITNVNQTLEQEIVAAKSYQAKGDVANEKDFAYFKALPFR